LLHEVVAERQIELAGETNAGAKNSTRLESMLAARADAADVAHDAGAAPAVQNARDAASGRVEISDGNARFHSDPKRATRR